MKGPLRQHVEGCQAAHNISTQALQGQHFKGTRVVCYILSMSKRSVAMLPWRRAGESETANLSPSSHQHVSITLHCIYA